MEEAYTYIYRTIRGVGSTEIFITGLSKRITKFPASSRYVCNFYAICEMPVKIVIYGKINSSLWLKISCHVALQ